MSDARPDAGPAPAEVASVQVALKGLCPRCGKPTLFASWIRFADSCRACGLDFSAFNVGDGPAALLILVLGGAIVAAAIALELSVSPPFWVHLLLWIPVTAIAVLGALRISKAGLLALEYRNKAREYRHEDPR